jgi:ATP-dependent RNA helicase DeaD
VRIFINVGSRDNATPRDIVGAITGEAGISSDKIGKIDLRDTHSLVEIAPDAAERVVNALGGVVIRGRRVNARLDQAGGERRESRPRERGGGAGSFGRPRGERPERGERGERGEGRRRDERGDRPRYGPRGGRPDRDDRGPRPRG